MYKIVNGKLTSGLSVDYGEYLIKFTSFLFSVGFLFAILWLITSLSPFFGYTALTCIALALVILLVVYIMDKRRELK